MAHDEQDYVDGWQTYSSWIDELRSNNRIIEKYDNDIEFRNNLKECKTNLDRFKLVWSNEEICKEIEQIYDDDSTRCRLKRQFILPKSFVESKRLRELGNKSFKAAKFEDALRQYTQAVRFAPYPDQEINDDSLALALANRSAALYSLTRYRLCLLDIDLAIKYGYPAVNMFKLKIRKVKCLHVLSVWANDTEQYKDELRCMLKSSVTKESVKLEINNMFEFIEQTQPEELEKDELNVVDETGMKISNVSKTLPHAADCVEMSFNGDKGRYLITNKDCSFGRLLLAEEPFVCNLAPSKRDEYCYNCFGRLHSCGLACEKCTQVLYCSIECLKAKAGTHLYECAKFIDFQDKIGVAYLVAHVMFKIDFNLTTIPIYTKKTVEKKTLDEVLNILPCDWPDLVYKNDYAAVLSLMDHAEDFSYDEMMGYILTTAYLITAFSKQFSSSTLELSNKDTQLVIGSVVLRHLLQLQTNLISILDQNLKDVVAVGHSITEIQERPIGVGIYPTISLLNHSCQPDIFSIFHRNKFVARASKSLECGTEINYCYGPSFTRMSKKDRQRRLKEQYFFTCCCDCCTDNKENQCRALTCPECSGPLIYDQDFTHTCMDCKKSNLIDVEKQLEQIKDLKSKLGELHISEIDDSKKLRTIKQIEGDLAKLVFWKNPIFVQIKSQLIECAENQENIGLALEYCQEELSLSDKTYGENSFESIMTKLKLINLNWQHLYNKIEDSKTDDEKETAIQELKTLLPTVSTTRGKLKDLLESTSIIGAESSFDAELKFLVDIQNNIIKYLASLEASSHTSDTS